MDGKLLARLGAIVFVAVAITATAIEMTRKDEEPVQASRPSVTQRQQSCLPAVAVSLRCDLAFSLSKRRIF